MIVFCAVGSLRSENHKEMALVLSKSIKKNTNLELYCIYDGEEDEFYKKMISTGGKVVFHKLAFESDLKKTADRKFNGDEGDWSIWKGAFLRLDVPLIVDSLGITDTYCIYVDCDTIFLKNPPALNTETFLAGPEFSQNNWSYFNSGVLYYNIPYMKSTYKDFIKFCYDHEFEGSTLGGPVDQGLINGFYRKSYQRLPLEMNWKPYWGNVSNATILHFHGPKPSHVEKMLNNDMEGIPEIYKRMFGSSPASYEVSLKMWKDIYEL